MIQVGAGDLQLLNDPVPMRSVKVEIRMSDVVLEAARKDESVCTLRPIWPRNFVVYFRELHVAVTFAPLAGLVLVTKLPGICSKIVEVGLVLKVPRATPVRIVGKIAPQLSALRDLLLDTVDTRLVIGLREWSDGVQLGLRDVFPAPTVYNGTHRHVWNLEPCREEGTNLNDADIDP